MSIYSRRKFIKHSLSAGALLMVPSLVSQTLGQAMKQGEKVKLGVVGVGSRGSYLVRIIQSFGDKNPFDIVAVCDNYEPNYQKAIKLTKGKAKAYYDHRKMLDDQKLDAIIIATPLFQHAHIAIDAMDNGVHVFCEKAMARHLEDIKKMADKHYETGKILHIGHQRLFDPKYLKGMGMVHNNKIGPIVQMKGYWHRKNDWRRKVPEGRPELERQINWRLYREYSCGLMTELASHQIQVANWAKQMEPVSVQGSGSIVYWKDGREVYDNVSLIYKYADGTHFMYDSMTGNRHYGLEEKIIGDVGIMEFETNTYIDTERKPKKPAGITQLIGDLQKDLFGEVQIGGASWARETKKDGFEQKLIEDDKTDGSAEQLLAFAASVLDNKPIKGLFEHGYHASVWTLLGQQAMDTGQAVTLPDFLKLTPKNV
jgi:predicted dehydrogenase